MPLPAPLTTGTVKGRFLAATVVGEDEEPRPAAGTVTFRPSPLRILAADAPAVILPEPVVVQLDADGYVGGEGGVTLVATDNDELDPVGWTWSAECDFGKFWSYSFSFELPAGSTVDLATVSPVPGADGTPMAGARAMAAAEEAARDAALALERAEDAESQTSSALLAANQANQRAADAETAAENAALAAQNAEGAAQDAGEAAQNAADDAEAAQNAASALALIHRGRWPVITIDLAGGADPVSKDTYTSGTYAITDTDGGIVHEGGIRLRGRGNSTWGYPKKPWRINFDVPTAPLGMTAVQRNWGLLADWLDDSKTHSPIAFTLGAAMDGLSWTPEFRTVELVLNGTYRGVHTLVDLARMEAGRIPGSEPDESGDGSDGTWLLEVENVEREGDGFATPVYGDWLLYDVPEEPTSEQEAYIAAAIGNFEQALYDGDWAGWQELADPTSFVDWWLINEVLRNADSFFWSSCKLTKDPDDGDSTGKIRMGPLWDFDRTFGLPSSTWNPTGFTTRRASWIDRMWQDASWRELVQERWSVLGDVVEAQGGWDAWIDQLIDARARAINDDDRRWEQTTYTAREADRMKRWIAARWAWLDAEINADINPLPLDDLVPATV